MIGKKIITGCVLAGLAILCAGACNPWDDGKNAVLVEEVYTVRPGDTVWGIAEEYVAKNTGTKRYILEYKAGMEERHGMIYPGDRLTLTYWVKEGER